MYWRQAWCIFHVLILNISLKIDDNTHWKVLKTNFFVSIYFLIIKYPAIVVFFESTQLLSVIMKYIYSLRSAALLFPNTCQYLYDVRADPSTLNVYTGRFISLGTRKKFVYMGHTKQYLTIMFLYQFVVFMTAFQMIYNWITLSLIIIIK